MMAAPNAAHTAETAPRQTTGSTFMSQAYAPPRSGSQRAQTGANTALPQQRASADSLPQVLTEGEARTRSQLQEWIARRPQSGKFVWNDKDSTPGAWNADGWQRRLDALENEEYCKFHLPE